MDESIDERYDASCAWKDLLPLSERFVGGNYGALFFVTTSLAFEEQVRVAIGVREVSDFIDDEHVWRAILTQPPSYCGTAFACRQITQELSGDGAEHGMAGDQRLMRDVLCQHRFADTVGADEDDVSRLLNELERQDRFDGSTIASRWPVPIELVEGLDRTARVVRP